MPSMLHIAHFHNTSTRLIRFLAVVLVFCFLTVTGCKHSVEPSDSVLNHPRTYAWTLDTLIYSLKPGDGGGQTIIHNIWGVSDTLVYAVGHDAFAKYGPIWKYDGRRWTRIEVLSPIDYNSFVFNTIHGFGPNNIYAFGKSDTFIHGSFYDRPLGVHFDGLQWKRIDLPPGRSIISMVTPSPSSIYCGGYHGKLFHYDGSKWSVDSIMGSPYPTVPLNVSVIGTTPNNGVYLYTEQWSSTPSFTYFKTFKYENSKFTTLDSAMHRATWGGRGFWQSDAGTLYSCGEGGIYQLTGEKWKLVYPQDFFHTIFGTNERHIFAVGKYDVFFYDGNSWESICPNFFDLGFSEFHIWCSETQVFITFTDGLRTYVLHGR